MSLTKQNSSIAHQNIREYSTNVQINASLVPDFRTIFHNFPVFFFNKFFSRTTMFKHFSCKTNSFIVRWEEIKSKKSAMQKWKKSVEKMKNCNYFVELYETRFDLWWQVSFLPFHSHTFLRVHMMNLMMEVVLEGGEEIKSKRMQNVSSNCGVNLLNFLLLWFI